jgi:hypothetical protein
MPRQGEFAASNVTCREALEMVRSGALSDDRIAEFARQSVARLTPP